MPAIRSVLGSFSYAQLKIERQHCIFGFMPHGSLVTAMNSIENLMQSALIRLQYVLFHSARGYNPDYSPLFRNKN